jgi:hypothetical protein
MGDGRWEMGDGSGEFCYLGFSLFLKAIHIFIKSKQSLYNLSNSLAVMYCLLLALYKQVNTSAKNERNNPKTY